MKKTTLVIIVVLLMATLFLSGCKNSEERTAFATVRQYVKLWNAQDAGGVFEITHQKTRTMGYKNQLDLQFATYDVQFKIEELSFDKIENGYAYLPFVATMKKTDSSDFQNVRITGTFVLAKENDKWKVLQMMVTDMQNIE